MAIGILSIITVIVAILIISTIVLGVLKRGEILNKSWYKYCTAFLIILLTFITFTSLPSNYIAYKLLISALAIVGLLSLYLNKIGKLKNDYTIIIVIISLIGNFCIGFLL